MVTTTALLALALFASTSSSAAKTGNELLPQCSSAIAMMDENRAGQASTMESFGLGYCVGLAHGVIQTIRAHQVAFGRKELGCIPSEIENGQAVRIVLKFLRDNPERLHEVDALLVIDALRQAYPCKAE